MKIMIRSREALEKMAEMQFAPGTAVVSIKNAEGSYPELKNRPEYLLQLCVDVIKEKEKSDCSQETTKERTALHSGISIRQIKEAVRFYDEIATKADVLICQCEDGRTHSAAIAAAVMEIRSRRGIDVFADDRYSPDKALFRRMLKHLKALKEDKGE